MKEIIAGQGGHGDLVIDSCQVRFHKLSFTLETSPSSWSLIMVSLQFKILNHSYHVYQLSYECSER